MATKTAARTQSKRRQRKSSTWVAKLKVAVVALFIVLTLVFIAGAGVFWMYKSQAYGQFAKFESEIVRLDSSKPSEIYSSDGKLLFQVSAEYRKPIEDLKEVPEVVQNAVIAAEDKRFWKHAGVDVVALVRIGYVFAKEGAATQGASTLTMQLAKRMVTGEKRSVERKLQDIALATVIEERKTKEEILLLYLNQVYFGAGAYGIKAAADVYFGKTLEQLTLSDAALLARLVQRPKDNPFNNPARALERRNLVLSIMREEGMVTEDQYRQAINETPKYSRRTMGTTARLRGAPYAVDHVMRELESEMNIGMDELKKGGYRVETTIDFELQKLAEQTVRDVVRSSARRNVTTGAFVVMDRDGRILAEVGGVDYRKNQFNAVSNPSARRQPGSAFKPFVYATALKLGTVNLNSSVSNEKIVMPNPGGRAWVPQNSQGGSGGWMSLRRAFTSSYNLPAIHTLQAVGPQTVVAFSRDSFGFKSELVPVPALALGSSAVSPLEMAQAYSVFMLKGDRARPYVIDRIYGPDGEIVRRYQPEIAKNVLDGWVVDQMDQLMRGVVEYGTGRAARSVPYARGKTGTTNDNRDAWFCGYTDSLVGIAWIANEQVVNGRPRYGRMPGVFGGNTSINIWRGVMQAAERKYGGKIDFERAKTPPQRSEQPDDDFPTGNLAAPDEVIEDTIEPAPPNEDEAPATDNTTVTNPVTEGAKAKASEPSRTTAPPPTPSPSESNELEVCADSGMRASIYCPETVTRRYRKGTEPRRTCPQHGG